MIFSERRAGLLGIVAVAALASALAAACSDNGDSPAEPPTASLTPTTAPAANPDLTSVTIMLQRSGCASTCLHYELTIHGDGLVQYEGQVADGDLRTETARISVEDVRLLVDRFNVIGFTDLDDNYGCGVIDGILPTTSFTDGSGSEKAVQRCSLDDETAPLFELEFLIDEIANSRQWIGLPEKVIEMSRGFYPAPDAEFCAWPCTDYTLTIYQDGRVEFKGFKNVDVVGTRNDEISEADLLDLVERYVESGFFDLPPDFHCQGTDVDATTTTVFLHTRRNSIERCHTGGPNGPLEPLRKLELVIAELTGLERWTGERPSYN